MMFCTNCGKEINDEAVMCPHCGTIINPEKLRNTKAPRQENQFAFIGFILSFFAAVVGLVFSILGYRKSAELNGEGRGFALAGIIISSIELATTVIALIIYGAVMIAMISQGYYPY